MKRRNLLATLGLASLVTLLTGCSSEPSSDKQQVAQSTEQQTYHWKLITSWPKNFPGLGTAPEKFAKLVDEMSNGRLTVKVYGAGELVPALEVFDAVSNGTAQMGHSAAYYWKGKTPSCPVFHFRAFWTQCAGNQ